MKNHNITTTINNKTYATSTLIDRNAERIIYVVDYLAKNPKSRCGAIAESYGCSIPSMSATLRHLVANKIVVREVIGTEMVNFGGEMGEADVIGFSLV
jgi:hypothetical protein